MEVPVRQVTLKPTPTFALLSLLILLVPSTAPAGTKWQMNIVPLNSLLNPFLVSPASKIKGDDKGNTSAVLIGVTDGLGNLVTTDGSYIPATKTIPSNNDLTGDEYMLIVHGAYPAANVIWEQNLPVELKGGAAQIKVSAAVLIQLMPSNMSRSLFITGADLWGPLGVASVSACKDNLVNGGSFLINGAPNPCKEGQQVEGSGVLIPLPH
jgi:hypothetical protein